MKSLSIASAALLLAALPAVGGEQETPFHPWDGSQTAPLHRIPIQDEAGRSIIPSVRDSMPFSARKTCGACHDYAKVGRGWHFNYALGAAPKGRPAQPWILLDQALGIQVPVSVRGWDHTWTPDSIGLTAWEFTKQFGRHLPGGGLAEPASDPADPLARWTVSGPLEINCLGCHSQSPRHDHSEWAKQVARENFRWAATASAGLGEVGGMASRMADSWEVSLGPNPDDHEYAVAPYVRYDLTQFDRKDRALLDIAVRPPDRNCLYCHSTAEVGKARKDYDADVHTVAGMNCVTCHRNGMDHRVARGYEAEAADTGDPSVARSSCRGCHLGAANADSKGRALPGGRLGAPVPEHKGLPPVHFDKLACTVCHSGSVPDPEPRRVRTARANRLGIYGVAQWATPHPVILQPVYKKGEDGKIAPHRMMWPAFWAQADGDKLIPLKASDVAPAAQGILDAPQQVGKILAALAADASVTGTPVLLTATAVLRVNADGGLDADPRPSAPAAISAGWAMRMTDGSFQPVVQPFNPEEPTIQDTERVSTLLKSLSALAPDPEFLPAAIVSNKVFKFDAAGLKVGDLAVEVGTGSTPPAGVGAVFGWLKNGEWSPLVPDRIVGFVVDLALTDYGFNEEQLARVLKTLAERGNGKTFAYVCSGKKFTLAPDGRLTASDHPAAEPAAWPLAHEVRTANHALGAARQCTDCHSATAPFFFGKVTAVGPLKTRQVQEKFMHEIEGQDASFHRLFGLTFLVRPLFKVTILCAGGLIAAILLLYGLLGLKRVTQFFGFADNK